MQVAIYGEAIFLLFESFFYTLLTTVGQINTKLFNQIK